MSTPTDYTYPLTAFVGLVPPYVVPNLDRLTLQVEESTIVTALASIGQLGTDYTFYFKDVLSAADQITLDTIVATSTGEPVSKSPPTTADGRPRVAAEKTDIAKTNFFSHDFTDKTTWYTSAIRVVGEVPIDSGDHTTYGLAHGFVIDFYHGKIFNEDFTLDAQGHSYRVAITVDGVPKAEIDPQTGIGDLTIDYDAGTLTFTSAQSPAAVVAVTYHYATDSTFTVKPHPPERLLNITFAEVQFAADTVLTDSVVFQVYGYVESFAPQLVNNPFPPGTLIPLGNPIVYKSIRDYQVEAIKSYPLFPAFSASSWRGNTQPILIMDWDYVSSTALDGTKGMEIRIKLQHDIPFGGEYASASFYCTSEPSSV